MAGWGESTTFRAYLRFAQSSQGVSLDGLLPAESLANIDLFDRLQLEAVVGVFCRKARTLSEAGRKLFDRSRVQRTVVNDADRLRK